MLLKKVFPIQILFIIFLACVVFPYYFQYTASYSVPTVISGFNIFENGELINSSNLHLAQRQLAWDLSVEESYPLPSILTATLLAITGLSYEQAAYIPIASLGMLLYFALAKYILPNKNNNTYTILFAGSYFLLNISNRLPILVTGRGCLGTTILILFVFSFIRFLDNKGMKSIPWFIICLTATAMIGGTYYTATLAIVAIVAISFIIIPNQLQFSLFKNNKTFSIPRGGAIIVSAIMLFLLPPVLAEVAPNLSINVLFLHVMDAVTSKIGLENNDSSQLYSVYLQTDLISQMRLWGMRLIILFSSLSIAIIILRGIRNKEQQNTRLWIYAFIVVGLFISEIPYALKVATIQTRFLVDFGFLCTLSLLSQYKKQKLASFAILFLIAVVVVGNSVFSLQQGGSSAAKIFAAKKITPVSDYIFNNLPAGTIAADAGYTTNIWLSLANKHKNSDIVVMPLGKDTKAIIDEQNGSVGMLADVLTKRNIDYILLNFDGTPYFGDVWGYSIKLHRSDWIESLTLSSIYEDGKFLLCKQ